MHTQEKNNRTHTVWLTYTCCDHSANRQKSHTRQTESKTDRETSETHISNREYCAHVCAMPKTRLSFNSIIFSYNEPMCFGFFSFRISFVRKPCEEL